MRSTIVLILSAACLAVSLPGAAAAPRRSRPKPAPAPPPAPAPSPVPAPPKPPDAKPADAKPTDAKPPEHKPGELKKYDEVITKEAKTEKGLFLVHRIGEKVYYEIPPGLLNKDMLWSTEVAQVAAGEGYGGTAAGDRVIRWTRRENKVYLRDIDYSVRAEGATGGIEAAVEAATLPSIIMSFDVETEGPDKAPVIEVTRLLTSDVPEFSVKNVLGGGGVDASRSYIDIVKPFPTNIETRVLLTFNGGGGGGSPFGGRYFGRPSNSALVHYSMVLLPDKPMRGRLYDSRVGYFTSDFEDFGRPEHRAVDRHYIARYRLEKKDPSAAISEPVKPLVYYISREVPEKWRPYLKQAVEAWSGAFEQAGFKNAIICKDAPSVQEDPYWDPEDARYSVIRWAPTDTENAMGPHIHDPRSGEILSAHIIVWHNVLKLAEDWYFCQVGDLDPRAKTVPLPDDLMGEILRYIVTHEVGHTLGLEHNFKASSSYTISELRNHDFTTANGDESSIMDYGRFNYVAQPGDNARLIPIIGPYDRFAIEWGYKPLPNATSPDDEKPMLDIIAARQMTDRQLRFSNSEYDDPTQLTEDLGDDHIEATRLGLKNINRVAQMLVSATTKFGENYDLLSEMYDRLYEQRETELFHVASLVGGVVRNDYHAGRGGEEYAPVKPERQAAAVQFLVENGFTTPKELLLPSILNRIESEGAFDRVLGLQRVLLASLLADGRIGRLTEEEALTPGKGYPVTRLFSQVQNGIWSELAAPHPTIDVYRRGLQRTYLQMMRNKLVGANATQSDLRDVALSGLRDLAQKIDIAIPLTRDPITAAHLADSRKSIERILDPKAEVVVQQSGGFFGFGFSGRTWEPNGGTAVVPPSEDGAGSAASPGGGGAPELAPHPAWEF